MSELADQPMPDAPAQEPIIPQEASEESDQGSDHEEVKIDPEAIEKLDPENMEIISDEEEEEDEDAVNPLFELQLHSDSVCSVAIHP